MTTLLNDLHLYELILLFLGIFLFLILSSGLMYYIIKKEEIKKLLLFFPIPILMIGYPSVKEITISGDKIALLKYQEEYAENPNDTVAKQKLEELAEKLEERAQSPEDIVQISKTKLLLGNTEEAIAYADKAIEAEEKKKEVAVETETTEDVAKKDSIKRDIRKRKFTNQALQLKQLAQIQNMVVNPSDTTVFKAKIKNFKVNDELKATKRIISRNALKRAKRSN